MNTLTQKRQQLLHRLKAQHQYRRLQVRQKPQQSGHNQMLDFASNNYLGLANHPQVNHAFAEGIKTWGTGSGAAHLINGHTLVHQQLEEQLAEMTGRSRALLFSTGYMANLALLNTLYDRDTTLLQDKLNHASLIDAGLSSKATMKRFAHKNLRHLQQLYHQATTRHKVIVSDGVFSMEGDLAPLKDYIHMIDPQHDEILVDDAHGFGVLGDKGGGICRQLKLDEQQIPVYMATLGKAVGCFGAFVAGSETLIDTLINQARSYIFTTATPPALAQACLQSLEIIRRESWRREKLHENIAFFQQYCQQLGLDCLPSTTAIQGIMIANQEKLLQTRDYLQHQGYQVGAIRPPTVPPNSSRLRITLSSLHDKQHIKVLLDLLDAFR